MWTELTGTSELPSFLSVLQASSSVYSSTILAGLERLLVEKSARFFLFDDGTLQLALCLVPKPDIDAWKIGHCVPTGTYEPEAAMKVAFTKIREIADEVGAASFYGVPTSDYGSARLNAFFDSVRDICWELSGDESKTSSFVYQFARPSGRKTEDTNWVGPRRQA